MNDYLMKNFITKKSSVLTEAKTTEENKYAIPKDILNGTNDTTDDDLADEELANANPDMEEIPDEQPVEGPETTDAPTDDTEVEPAENSEAPVEDGASDDTTPEDTEDPAEEPAADQQPQNPDFDENGDDPTSVANDVPPENTDDEYNSTEFGGEELNSPGDVSEEEIETEAEETPGLRILSSVSDNQYNLLNIELYKKFEDLVKNIQSTIEISISTLKPDNDRLVQAKDIVYNNLTRMIDDLRNYMQFTWHNEYESNVVAYAVFMKRYKVAIDIIGKIKANKSN